MMVPNVAAWRETTGFCAYCGTPCIGRVCRAHADLPAREYDATLHRGTGGFRVAAPPVRKPVDTVDEREAT